MVGYGASAPDAAGRQIRSRCRRRDPLACIESRCGREDPSRREERGEHATRGDVTPTRNTTSDDDDDDDDAIRDDKDINNKRWGPTRFGRPPIQNPGA